MNSNRTQFSLLVVDDDPVVLSLLKEVFSEDDYHLHTSSSGMDALDLMQKTKIDVALIDWKMPGMDGITLLKEIKNNYPSVRVIMITGEGGINEAVEAMKQGADDFLEKPFSITSLKARVRQLYHIWELKEENQKLRNKIEFKFGFNRLVGNSTPILNLKQLIVQIGPTDESVLIQAETGTGKELVANAIHHHSRRSENNFVPVDCAAISETVIESELFGHVKGAFTGAHLTTLGLIRSAEKGTLFLDEVGELSIGVQTKRLRVIQEREVRPVGSTKNHPVDIRIVAATKRDLTEEASMGNFREDLFYRLDVVNMKIPPLRDRKEDIPLLAAHFIEYLSNDFTRVKEVSQEALMCMERYSWPGNVRELENVIRRAMALVKTDIILPEHLPSSIYTPPGDTPQNFDLPSSDNLAAYELAAIQNALTKSGNKRKKAAEILEIGEATLYRKLKKYGIKS
ncbi:MAG TPA: sigma-54-dependent Fis family transcriptional regulator [Desulfobacterales bacterium]|nr:sigma-54-dependent Fis family transcriptional regulator [Desulfobacterales bacterium]